MVWGNPFLHKELPEAFEEVLERMEVGVEVAKPVYRGPSTFYDHTTVQKLDRVLTAHDHLLKSHRPAQTARRAPPAGHEAPGPPLAPVEASVEGDGGFFLTQAAGISSAAEADEGAAPTFTELQDTLLQEDEARAMLNPAAIDLRTAVNALKYALEHPLAEHDPSLPTGHQRPTAATLNGRRDKFEAPVDAKDVGRARQASLAAAHDLDHSMLTLPERIAKLRQKLKFAEYAASLKLPTMTNEGVAALKKMLEAVEA